MYFTQNALGWLENILQERFGNFFILGQEEESFTLIVPGALQGSIRFNRPQSVFRQSRSDFSCKRWRASAEGFEAPIDDIIPAPSEEKLPVPLIEVYRHSAIINYDLLGLVYWSFTRLEEVNRTDLDQHQRFPATSSHAYKHGYLERPIVDEWLNILGQVIMRVWPEIKLKEHKFDIKVSHDVDEPSRYVFASPAGLVRAVGNDVLVRKDYLSPIRAPWIWLRSRNSIRSSESVNTFDWLMKQSEANGLTSAFYFICGRTDARKDASYDPEMPQIRNLMREIHGRGHEIGLHPSYNTFNAPEEIAREAKRLQKVCSEERINQTEWGGRMHYLRWDHSITLKALADAGMTYDSTLSYADRPGFRCGTCFEYHAFDAVTDQPLPLILRPLIAMDCTVIAERYLGLGSTEAAYHKFDDLKEKCRKVGGVFTLLWHNSFFNTEKDFEIYSQLVSEKE